MRANGKWHIRGGRLLDPATKSDAPGDLFIDGDVIVAERPAGAAVVEAQGLLVAPALIDLHVHLREPGNPAAETVLTGCRSAARGGFGTIVAMPNTTPAADTPAAIAWLLGEAARHNLVEVLPAGCLTRGRAGRIVADIAEMAAAGAAAFTDDGTTPADERLMQEALRRCASAARPVMDHALDPVRAGKGAMHEGDRARLLGIPGIPSEAETSVIARDIDLCQKTGCRTHIQHISTAAGVEMIRAQRRGGLPLTAEATPHHLALTDADVRTEDANFKMNPPLRGQNDRDAITAGVLSGTITCLATDHAPHTAASKALPFADAPFGVIGMETAVGVSYTLLVRRHGMPIMAWLQRWTAGPAEVLGRPCPSLAPGRPATVVLLDIDREWQVDPATFASLSRNTPFAGWRLAGRAQATFFRGQIAWRNPALKIAP